MNVTDIQDMIGLLSREQGPAVFCWVQEFITALVQKKGEKKSIYLYLFFERLMEERKEKNPRFFCCCC